MSRMLCNRPPLCVCVFVRLCVLSLSTISPRRVDGSFFYFISFKSTHRCKPIGIWQNQSSIFPLWRIFRRLGLPQDPRTNEISSKLEGRSQTGHLFLEHLSLRVFGAGPDVRRNKNHPRQTGSELCLQFPFVTNRGRQTWHSGPCRNGSFWHCVTATDAF